MLTRMLDFIKILKLLSILFKLFFFVCQNVFLVIKDEFKKSPLKLSIKSHVIQTDAKIKLRNLQKEKKKMMFR